MTYLSPQASIEDVLESFSIEHDVSAATLQRYLSAYPTFAAELVDLSCEISRTLVEDGDSLSAADQRLISLAVTRIQIAPGKAAADPLSDLSAQKMRDFAKTLKVPRQVVMAFQERSVVGTSIPQRFLNRFAALVQSNAQLLLAALDLPSMATAGSYKSDGKPIDVAKVTFEQLLRDADLSEEDIVALMEDDV